jgi:hypothetical protein
MDDIQSHTIHNPLIPSAQHMQALLGAFSPIHLSEMNDVTLLNRVDTKYMLGVSQLEGLLPQLLAHYQILEIGGLRLNHYQTLYFDTPDFMLYQQHHNGLTPRYKVRARKYVESDLTFFEVKHKTNQKRTIKSRLQIPDFIQQIDAPIGHFVGNYTPLTPQQLEPKLWNHYQRLTLVSKSPAERVTIDLNLAFEWEERAYCLPQLAVIEVKTNAFSRHSKIIQLMRQSGIYPTSFSKYCAGVWSLYEGAKVNNFKSQIIKVNKLVQKEIHHAHLH